MLDTFIKDKSQLISYNRIEMENISTTLSNLKNIINNQPQFRAPFLGGSYKRRTMVKGISDVDVYFEYIGNGNSQAALATLKSCLMASYPTSDIRQDKPSILVDFNKIPINITPYKLENGLMGIPDNVLLNWKAINFGQLENAVDALRSKNIEFIDLIKILKLWNYNYKRGLKNYDIEIRVCNLFLNSHVASQGISDWIWTFFQNNNFKADAVKFFGLMKNNFDPATLKTEWLKFIDNK